MSRSTKNKDTLAGIAALPSVADASQRVEHSLNADQLNFVRRIGERHGRQQSIDALQKIVTAAHLIDLQQIKESKSYKGIPYEKDGAAFTIRTWEDYCDIVEGRSRELVDEQLRNLRALGASMFDALERAGIGYRRMRDLRSVSPEARQQLIEAAKTGNESLLLSAAEDLIEQQDRERTQLEEAKRRLETTIAAKDRRFSEVQQALNDAKDKLEHREHEESQDPEGTQLKSLQRVTLKVQAALLEALTTIDDVMQRPASDSSSLAARQTLDFIGQRLAEGAQQRGLTLNFDGQTLPASMQPVYADAEAGTLMRGRRK